jgi:hypothetical protein
MLIYKKTLLQAQKNNVILRSVQFVILKHSHLKINIAILVFLTFVFRLAFLNASIVSTLKASQVNKVTSSLNGFAQKRANVNSEELANLKLDKYASLEFYEENSDNEEDLIKSNTPILLSYLESTFKTITNSPKSNDLFDAIKCKLYPKRYLSLSVLKI